MPAGRFPITKGRGRASPARVNSSLAAIFLRAAIEVASHFHYRLNVDSVSAPRAYGLRPLLAALALSLAVSSVSPGASATPHPLPFSYPYATLPSGTTEAEQYVDLVPVRVARELPGSTESVVTLRSALTTEIEVGITDHLEAGWYFAFEQSAAANGPALRFSGVKQRLRYRFAEEGELPVDIGLYLEVAELYSVVEVEEKILLSRRFGPLTVISNLWLEQEYLFQDDVWKHIYHPTFGVSFEASPRVAPGLEYWVRGTFGSGSEESGVREKPHHYLGPTLLLQMGETFLSLGGYARLDDFAKTSTPGDPWGKLWVRAILGVGL
jgi:hypothetical protein